MYSATLIGILLAMLACGYAIVCGGKPERVAGALILVDWIASPLLASGDAFHHTQLAIFMMDSVLTLVLLFIAMSSKRFWPLWVAAFQVLEVLIHIAMLVDHGVRPRAYFIGIEISSYLILLALAIGTWSEAPRRAPPQGSVALEP
jgi:hypothetical protein